MAQPPPDQNFYHHTLPHAHPHPHSHSHPHPHQHPQLQLPPQFRNPFDLLFDERTGAINYNYIRPYLPNQIPKPDELSDSLVMRRPRRTRTTFTSSQIAELEQHFLQGRYLTAPRLADLSAKLALGTAQVKIWFKNRRRRHKIQSDQHKDQSYDGMPLSPSMPSSLKPVEADPPSLQALSLGGGANGNGGAASNALTPSPTPSTPTAHLVEHYSETFNAYYNYNGHHGQGNGRHGPPHSVHSQYGASAPNTVPQFFPSAGMQHQQGQQQLHQQAPPLHQQAQHHLHPQHHQAHPSHVPHQQQQQQQQLPPLQQQQQQQQQHQQQQQQQQYHHFDFQQKAVSLLKDDPESDYNFNSSYYMRMSAAAASTALPSVASEVTSALSPGSEVYEPLTPKNDESPSLCGGGGNGSSGSIVGGGACPVAAVAAAVGGAVDVIDDIDNGSSKKTTLQTLEPLKSSNVVGADKTCESGSNGVDGGHRADSAPGRCDGIFGKFSKPPAVTHEPMHETNQYQCTMDTIMQAYNPHRNAAGNSQFAYCFN